jgi:hypothetical protein
MKPSERFVWFFRYHVFDVTKAREIAAKKPVLNLTTVNILPLLGDGPIDLDAARRADVKAVAIIARVPIGQGEERYLLIDGYEVAKRCYDSGKPLRLRVLSLREAYRCRLSADSCGEWPSQEEM